MRGAILVVVGTGAILRPALTVAVLAAVAGIGLVVAGLGEIVAATGARPSPSTAIPRRRLRVSVAVCVGAVALVASTVAVGSLPVGTQVSAAVSNQPAGASDACNGYVALCSRPYNDVAFPATHNAMSAADEPGWFIPEQPTGIIGQLNAGIRVLLIDSYYGQLTTRTGLIATAPESYEAALADTEANLGPTAVASALRLRDAITSRPVGPVIPFLCHGLCEIGATQWQPMMKQVKSWLDAHPRQVVTFFIQDTVSPADTAAVFSQAGLNTRRLHPDARPALAHPRADDRFGASRRGIDGKPRRRFNLPVVTPRLSLGARHPLHQPHRRLPELRPQPRIALKPALPHQLLGRRLYLPHNQRPQDQPVRRHVATRGPLSAGTATVPQLHRRQLLQLRRPIPGRQPAQRARLKTSPGACERASS